MLLTTNEMGMSRKIQTEAIIGDGDRTSWDPRAPMIWDNFAILRTNYVTMKTYIHADPRTCRGFSRGYCHVAWSKGESCEAGNKNQGAYGSWFKLIFEQMKNSLHWMHACVCLLLFICFIFCSLIGQNFLGRPSWSPYTETFLANLRNVCKRLHMPTLTTVQGRIATDKPRTCLNHFFVRLWCLKL